MSLSTGGRSATFSIDECANNIIDILKRTIAIQERLYDTTIPEVPEILTTVFSGESIHFEEGLVWIFVYCMKRVNV